MWYGMELIDDWLWLRVENGLLDMIRISDLACYEIKIGWALHGDQK
jgi:hypothetical protein